MLCTNNTVVFQIHGCQNAFYISDTFMESAYKYTFNTDSVYLYVYFKAPGFGTSAKLTQAFPNQFRVTAINKNI